MKYNWFNDIIYDIIGNECDIVQPAHERIRNIYIHYMDLGADDSPSTLATDTAGYVKFVNDVECVLDMDQSEITDIIADLPSDRISFSDFCLFFYDVLDEFNPDELIKEIQILNRISTVKTHDDPRIASFDTNSPLWRDEFKTQINKSTPHNTYCMSFNNAQTLKYDQRTPRLTQTISNKIDLKDLRSIVVWSTMRQCAESYKEHGDGHTIDHFENPGVVDCVAANGVYNNLIQQYKTIDKFSMH